MVKVCILGTGKVGSHFIKECINNTGIHLIQIYNRSSKGLRLYKDLLATTQSVYELKQADIYIIALPDDAIATLDLQHVKGLVVHTSGTVSYQQIQAQQRGVLYPPQSFSKEKSIHFKNIHFCLDVEFNKDRNLLEHLVTLFAASWTYLSEEQRQKLHIAAVFANNFSNRIIGIAYDLCKEHRIDFKILQPLLQETFLKTQILPPNKAQTGPALRNDEATIAKHLAQLDTTNKEIYKILTQSIQEKHNVKL